jgi:hypothetical protein
MKKMLLRTIVFCMTGSLLALSAFAQEREQTPGQPGAQPGKTPGLSATGRLSMQGQSCRISKALNAEVKTAQGETLGKIEDFIVNPASGKIEFAVLGREDKFTAVPMQLLSAPSTAARAGVPSPTGTETPSFTFTADKQKFDQAPSFDKNQWPEFNQAWKQQIYSHYGVRGEGVGAPGSPSGTERGLGTPDRRPGQEYPKPDEPRRSPKPPGTPDNP